MCEMNQDIKNYGTVLTAHLFVVEVAATTVVSKSKIIIAIHLVSTMFINEAEAVTPHFLLLAHHAHNRNKGGYYQHNPGYHHGVHPAINPITTAKKSPHGKMARVRTFPLNQIQ